MNGRDKRQQRRHDRRTNARRIRLCPNGCGEPGPHFVPPSLGERGFYTCKPKAAG